MSSQGAARGKCWLSDSFFLLIKSRSSAHGLVLTTFWESLATSKLSQSVSSLKGMLEVSQLD